MKPRDGQATQLRIIPAGGRALRLDQARRRARTIHGPTSCLASIPRELLLKLNPGPAATAHAGRAVSRNVELSAAWLPHRSTIPTASGAKWLVHGDARHPPLAMTARAGRRAQMTSAEKAISPLPDRGRAPLQHPASEYVELAKTSPFRARRALPTVGGHRAQVAAGCVAGPACPGTPPRAAPVTGCGSNALTGSWGHPASPQGPYSGPAHRRLAPPGALRRMDSAVSHILPVWSLT